MADLGITFNYGLGLPGQLPPGLTWRNLILGQELKNNLEKILVNFEIITGIFDQFLEILGLLSLNFKQVSCKIYRKFE